MRSRTRNLYARVNAQAAVVCGIVALIAAGLFLLFMINMIELLQMRVYPDAIANGFFAWLTGVLALIMGTEVKIRVQKVRGYSQLPYHK